MAEYLLMKYNTDAPVSFAFQKYSTSLLKVTMAS